MNKRYLREVIGERLKEFRGSRGLSLYYVAKHGEIRFDQAKEVELGDQNYTIDVFLGYIKGCGLYMYFAEKTSADGTHDFEDLFEKGIERDPQ
jgi:transcriptional regulator with XRE-family HTH domain